MVSCNGLFADIRHKKNIRPTSTTDLGAFDTEKRLKFERLLAQYSKYKREFLESIFFEPDYIFKGDIKNYSM